MLQRAQRIAAIVLGAAALALVLLSVRVLTRPAEPGPVRLIPAASAPAVLPERALLDLNDATPEELMELPGIGETLAGRLVAWREENGDFRTPEDIMSVQGIGEATYAAIEPFITY